jgi:hypothetical protein
MVASGRYLAAGVTVLERKLRVVGRELRAGISRPCVTGTPPADE